MSSARGLCLFVLLLLFIVTVKCRRLGTSDGVDHDDEINNMNPENASFLLKLGVSDQTGWSSYTSKKSCESIYGFLPCSDTVLESVFLIIMYSYVLMLGEEWLQKGSKALLLYFQNRRMAGSVFRVLMALPRVFMVIVSGAICTESDARNQVAFGIAMYAGSTVITLTGIWGVNVILIKEDLDSHSKPTTDTSSTGLPSKKSILSFLKDVGVHINEDTRGSAFVLLLSLIPFAVVVLLQLEFSDRVTVSISLIVSALSLCSYIAYQILNPDLQARSVAHLKEEQFQEMFLMKLQNLASECLYKAGKPNIEAINSIFKLCDHDGSGHLKPDELKKFIHDNIDDKDDDLSIEFQVKEITRHFDNDGKEGVSMDEFVQGCTKWLNKWNAPQNGLSASSHALFNKFVADHKVEDFSVIPKTLYKPLISNLRGNEDVEAHEETIEKLFSEYDKNKDGEMSYDELQDAIVKLGLAKQDPAGFAKSIIDDLDIDGSRTINKKEFMTRLKNLTEMANEHASGNNDLLKFIQEFSTTMTAGKTKKENPLIILYAVFGALTIYLFAGPYMESVIQFSNALNIPFLFTSFVVAPFFMNTKSMITSIISTLFSQKKSFNKSASLAFSELYGGLVMNNLMGLTTLLTIVYIRRLTWDYTAELVTIVMIGLVMGTFAVTHKTYNLWASIASFFLYGTSTIVFCVYAWQRN